MSEEPWVVVEDPSGMEDLAARIRDDMPFAVSVHNSLVLHARRHFDANTFYALRHHPHAHVVMWLQMDQALNRTCIAVHCLKEEVGLVHDAVMATGLVAWQGNIQVFHMSEYLVATVQDVLRTRGGGELTMALDHTFIRQPLHQEPISVCGGMAVCRLGGAGVRHMLSTSEYDKHLPLDAMMYLARHAPCAAVYEDPNSAPHTLGAISDLPQGPDDATPLAWITTSFYGALSILMTKEAWRGRGLAGLVTEATGRLGEAQGYIPHAHVEVDNQPSINMFSKLPGWRLSHTVTYARQDYHKNV